MGTVQWDKNGSDSYPSYKSKPPSKLYRIFLTHQETKSVKGTEGLLPKFVNEGRMHEVYVTGFMATPIDSKLSLLKCSWAHTP